MKNKILISILSIVLLMGGSVLARERESIPEGVDAPYGLSRVNMLPDGSFDTGLNVWNFGSHGTYPGLFKSAIVQGDPDGENCLKLSIVNDGTATNSIQARVNTIAENFVMGETYIFSFWAKTDNVDAYSINSVWLRSMEESKAISDKRPKVELICDGQWHYYAVPMTVIENADKAGVMIFIGSQGKKDFDISFDDIKLRAVNKTEPRSLPELSATESVYFEDISGHWAEKEIREMAAMGIINGRDALIFDPEAPVTRGEMVALLVRGIGYGPATQKNPFFDTKHTDWYANELDIIADAGVIDSGMLWQGNFFGDAQLKRQELAMFIANSYDVMLNTATADFDIRFYSDKKEIDDWAIIYIMRCTRLGLMEGIDWNVFAPQDTVTRAQAATAIYRLRNTIAAELS